MSSVFRKALPDLYTLTHPLRNTSAVAGLGDLVLHAVSAFYLGLSYCHRESGNSVSLFSSDSGLSQVAVTQD